MEPRKAAFHGFILLKVFQPGTVYLQEITNQCNPSNASQVLSNDRILPQEFCLVPFYVPEFRIVMDFECHRTTFQTLPPATN